MSSSALRSSFALAVFGGALAASIAFGAPSAFADPGNTTSCQPGQVVIDGQCSVPAPQTDSPPPDNHSSGDNGHH
ncbi:hypothetical protein BayCH28_15060 [Mycolicibacterium sp. CH28]|uniref:hypothetical protein n=1 Tax=Mycolicibacterium sp. CH28 TaxID=2512237 RepID=UPI001080C58A|nr:hypothetical protein [Mycolicibacterium sp. CH28]TGD87002.1 hypothetical protein BayCH28_15060 [Mycolicibacterium sp. CH28]